MNSIAGLPLPQELAATFLGALNYWFYWNFLAHPLPRITGREPRGSRVEIRGICSLAVSRKMAQPQVPHISQEHAHHFA